MTGYEVDLGFLQVLGLRDNATITEVIGAYLKKVSQSRFQKVILGDESLEEEFIRYYRAYTGFLPRFNEEEKLSYLNEYPSDQLSKLDFSRGVVCLLNREYIKAGENFQKALKYNQKDVLTLIYLGILLLKRKNYYAAEKYFSQAVRLDKNNVDAWFYLGENFFKAKEYRKSIDMFETAKALNPGRTEISYKIKDAKIELELLTKASRGNSMLKKFKKIFKG
jgi:tetratricopeptide (TPR) repeat protein